MFIITLRVEYLHFLCAGFYLLHREGAALSHRLYKYIFYNDFWGRVFFTHNKVENTGNRLEVPDGFPADTSKRSPKVRPADDNIDHILCLDAAA